MADGLARKVLWSRDYTYRRTRLGLLILGGGSMIGGGVALVSSLAGHKSAVWGAAELLFGWAVLAALIAVADRSDA